MQVDILLFTDFEALDVFGPVEIFGQIEGCRLRFLSADGGLIGSRQQVQVQTLPWHRAEPASTLLVPGGIGARMLVEDKVFLKELARRAEQSEYCLSVCTGSALLARAGVLDGYRATSNKQAFAWVKSQSAQVHWQGSARWVTDGKFYTSSGVSAGLDMTLRFVADRLGQEKAQKIASYIEYLWHEDAEQDAFAVPD